MVDAEELAREELERLLFSTDIPDEVIEAVMREGIEGGLRVLLKRRKEVHQIIERVRRVYVEAGGDFDKPVEVKGYTFDEILKEMKEKEKG